MNSKKDHLLQIKQLLDDYFNEKNEYENTNKTGGDLLWDIYDLIEKLQKENSK